MKKTCATILLLLFLLSLLSGCGSSGKAAITVSGSPVPNGVFAYYLDLVSADPASFNAGEDNDSIISAAAGLCAEYSALFSFMEKNEIRMEQYLKSEANDETDGIWSIFGEYYKNRGITKADILNIRLFENGKRQVVSHLFGKGGKHEVSQDDLKQSFVELYVGFKAIEAPLSKLNSKGETISLSESEKAELEEQFERMRSRFKSGTDIDTLNREYCKSRGLVATQSLEVSLVKKGDVMYENDFFEKVGSISHGSAAVIESESTIYLIERCTIATSDEDAFAQYESEVLEHLKLPWVEKKITALAEKSETVQNEKIIKKLSAPIFAAREKTD